MTRPIAFAALLALALGACAGTPKELAAHEREECRSIPVTGSKFPKQDCRTVSDWAKYDEEEKARSEGLLGTSRQGVQP